MGKTVSEKLTRQAAKLREEGYIPALEAAQLAGVAVQTVYRWMDGGRVSGKIARPWYRFVLKTSLEAFLKPQDAAAPASAPPDKVGT